MSNFTACRLEAFWGKYSASHFVFDYHNSGISWSIFYTSVSVEAGRSTLQCTYLTVWWRHITRHKSVLLKLLLKIKYVEFEDRTKIFKKIYGKFFLQKTNERISYR